jgi:hypothetical protein
VRESLAITGDQPPHFAENSLILWLFGAGIPREIKRNMITCYSEKAPISESAPSDLWRILYRAKLNAMLLLSAPSRASEAHDHYRFLICVEQIMHIIDDVDAGHNPRLCTEGILGAIRDQFQPLFKSLFNNSEPRKTKAGAKNGKSENGDAPDPTLYLAQLMEAIIGAIAFALIARDDSRAAAERGDFDVLIYVYKFIPINPQYAFYALEKFLDTRLRSLDVTLDLLRQKNSPAVRSSAQSLPA